MEKTHLLALLLLALAVLCAFFLVRALTLQPQKTILLSTPISQISAKIADDDFSRSRGLMFERSLCENCGMLFIFEDSQQRHFWMKNTYLPLDIIFLYENMSVESVHAAAPCKSDPCPAYSSAHPVKYALEININRSRKFAILPGAQLIASNLSTR